MLAGVSPADPGFLRALELLGAIQRAGALSLRVRRDAQKQETTILSFRSQDVGEEALARLRELRELLRLDPEATEIKLVFGATPASGGELAVATRSIRHMLGTMAALVDVPPEHVAEGRAVPGLEGLARPADQPSPTLITSGKEAPPDAFVAVHYRDHWFWIDDRDLRSKRAFAFMMMLFTLADTGERESLPLVTIPAQ